MPSYDLAELLDATEHYLSAGMRWGVFTRLINGRFGTSFSSTELQKLFQSNRLSSRKRETNET